MPGQDPLASTTTAGAQPQGDGLACWARWQALADRLTPTLSQPLSGLHTLDTLHEAADQVMALTRQQTDAALFHVVHAPGLELQRYSVVHALHTGMLMSLIGQRKEWSPTFERSGVLAALTMNLSITTLQNHLALHDGRLDALERTDIQHHPTESRWLLEALGVTDADWLDAVEQHHEQPDGSGYPQGLTGTHVLADALRTCDVLGAKLSPRGSRPGLLSPRVASELFQHRSAGYFGATLIRELGLYPPGSLVHLNTGDVAVVLRRTRDPMTPDVVPLFSSDGRALPALQRCATSRAPGRCIVSACAQTELRSLLPTDRVLAMM
jgi:hypothetical protein